MMRHRLLIGCRFSSRVTAAAGCRRIGERRRCLQGRDSAAGRAADQAAADGRTLRRPLRARRRRTIPGRSTAMMANETSSTDITDRLFGFLVDYNLATQQYRAGDGEIVGGRARRRDVDVPPAQRRRVLRRPSDHGGGCAVFVRGCLRRDAASRRCRRCCRVEGKNFTVTAPDPYTVVINTGKPHAALARCAHVQAACRSFRSTCCRSRTRTGRLRRPTTSARRPTSW